MQEFADSAEDSTALIDADRVPWAYLASFENHRGALSDKAPVDSGIDIEFEDGTTYKLRSGEKLKTPALPGSSSESRWLQLFGDQSRKAVEEGGVKDLLLHQISSARVKLTEIADGSQTLRDRVIIAGKQIVAGNNPAGETPSLTSGSGTDIPGQPGFSIKAPALPIPETVPDNNTVDGETVTGEGEDKDIAWS